MNTIIAALLLLAMLTASFLLYRVISRNPDREAISDLLEKLVVCVGICEAEDYLQFVDLDEFGFRLEYWGNMYSYAKSEQEYFIGKAQEWTPTLKKSETRILKADIEVNVPTASAKVTVHWKKASSNAFGPESALIACDFKLAAGANGWRISSARLYPANELIIRR